MSLAPVSAATPLVADVRFTAHGGNRRYGIALDFLDAGGATLATGLTDPDALDAFGRQAMAVAAAARACDPNVIPIALRPTAQVPLGDMSVSLAHWLAPASPSWEEVDAQVKAFLYMVAACAALLLAIGLVAWDLLK